MTEQGTTTTMTSHKKEPEPAPSQRRPVRTAVGWLTGWTPTKMAFSELTGNVRLMAWLVRTMKAVIDVRLDEVRAQKELAKVTPETMWADMIRDFEITDATLRRGYRITYWTDVALLLGLAISVGILIVNFNISATSIANAFFANLILILHVMQLHRMYIAREQRCISVLALARQVFFHPSQFLPLPLPEGHKLRSPSPPAPDAKEG
ncbi:hypothetical protein [Pseudomonas aeruginosa]|nr:hypothetical protein [Pseudomonas aeruginosa]ELT7041033.1 hypothetical protein [Pseudomonas aeruginosa]KAA5588785.1 hypothetical protein F3H14_26250 [Pseudomonas aeruginosa]MBG6418179.1 hypothetical protein [Pseudomonas aeruginosa]MBH8810394.1 hypothetical protein [Pseudomonas aeruginosa]MBH8829012.1 hypothetical protein [Pseudomonas aeruginosa]